MDLKDELFQELHDSLPNYFSRKAIDQLMGGMIGSKTLANLNSAGEGPPYYKIGRKVFYEREAFWEWFGKRIKKIDL